MRDKSPIAPDSPNKKALILPGGGIRVAYQAGAIQALHTAGLRFSYADGTSGGVMNLAALLSGVTPDDLVKRWRTLRPKEFVSLIALPKYFKLLNLPSFGDFDSIEQNIFPHLGINCNTIRKSTGTVGQFNVCDFADKKVIAIPSTEIEKEYLFAGISLPIFMPAVNHKGKTWTDAVWIKDSNMIEMVRKGANELWVVWCIGNAPKYNNGALNQYVHMIEMSAISALNAELKEIERLNALIKMGDSPYGHRQEIVVHLIKPSPAIPLDPDYVSGKVNGSALVDQGYMDTMQYLEAKPKGLALNLTATQIAESTPGVSFRETMGGRISFYTSDPKTGWRDHNSLPIKIHATINIRNIAAFVKDQQHRGSMAAHLDCPRLGGILSATKSNFQLFSPQGDPGHLEMVYEMGFLSEGQHYWFSGRKAVKRNFFWFLWRDTTTLYVKIYKGHDIKGEVVAAGVMRLGVGELLALVKTLHARDCSSISEKLKSIYQFAKFFTEGLWQTYGFGKRKPK